MLHQQKLHNMAPLYLPGSNAGQKSAEGRFFSKLVYKFCPSQKLAHLSGCFKHHIGGGQLPKNTYENKDQIWVWQDKNRPKADSCPSWFINFGQQKSCAPIFIT